MYYSVFSDQTEGFPGKGDRFELNEIPATAGCSTRQPKQMLRMAKLAAETDTLDRPRVDSSGISVHLRFPQPSTQAQT